MMSRRLSPRGSFVRAVAFSASLPAVALAQQSKPPAPAAPPAATPTPAVTPAAPAGTPPATAPATAEAPSSAAPAPAAAAPEPAAPAPAPATVDPVAPAPVAPAEPAPAETVAADASALSLEEQALIQELGAEAANDEYKLDIYGFVDFTYHHRLADFSFSAPFNSFAVGNFNVYLSSALGDGWRSLAEVRFTYLPHGNQTADATGNFTRTDTTAADYTDLGRPLRWGGVVIERAWLEYAAHPLLTVRGGHWLTPYGIWNVDHGSPVIIGVRRPFIVGESLFPTSQTGLELYGTQGLGVLQLGYHLTLSNGRGPLDRYQDLNANKAVGGRLFGRVDSSFGTLTLGLSAYRGDYTDRGQSFTVNADGDFVADFPRVADYDELSYAADLKWEFSGFWLQSEAIVNEVAYEDGFRPPVLFATEGPPGYAPDFRRLGVYGLTGYRFDFIGLMPFTGAEYYQVGGDTFVPNAAAFFLGLNVRPTARVVLKVQYTYSWNPGVDDAPENSHYNAIDSQVAWSF